MNDPEQTIAAATSSIESAWARLQASAAEMSALCHGYVDDFDTVLAARLHALDTEHADRLKAIEYEYGQASTQLSARLSDLSASYPYALVPWNDPSWSDVHSPEPPSNAIPLSGLRIGEWELPTPGLPAIPVIFPIGGAPLIVSTAESHQHIGRDMIAAAALRLVGMLPASRVHLTLIDPLGHGANLSAFLRLPAKDRTDSVLWTEDDIQKRLEEIGREIEDVIQRRLGNVFDTIEDYNEHMPGQVAPFRALVLLDFPQSFSERELTQLAQLLRAAPRAGLVALIHRNAELGFPERLNPAVEAGFTSTVFVSGSGQATWTDPDFGELAFSPDLLPPPERVNALLDAIAIAQERGSKSVGFETIRIRGDVRWSGSSFDGVRVPIGLTDGGEPLLFTLGFGRGQHALVGGDTQRGKTNLLHVLISQLALLYPPEELALYLLDFKGPEFLPYLAAALPHARAVALKTDPEFGLSVLKHFQEQIAERDRLFRQAGVATFRDYRQRTGQPLPRAVAILDEAHVLFDSDRFAHDSEPAAVLEDVARRGAGFGVHLILATQSPASGGLRGALGPVYEQMGLRLALPTQDIHVAEAILGNRNTASTELAAAGEIIVNDAGGRMELNQRGRVAFLSLDERESLLAQVASLAEGERASAPASFDGDRPANLLANTAFAESLSTSGWPAQVELPVAWLGEPVAVSSELSAPFERYPGANLLIGGAETESYGLLTATIFSLAAQVGPDELAFHFLDFARPASLIFGALRQIAESVPHDVKLAGPREATAMVEALTAEMNRRREEEDATSFRHVLVIAGTHRWRDLQDHRQNPLTKLVDEGPDWGIHTVAWVDGLTRGNPLVRYFDLRAALLLNEEESDEMFNHRSVATRLREGRAIYRQQDWSSGRFQLFKPYPMPSTSELAEIAARLKGKVGNTSG